MTPARVIHFLYAESFSVDEKEAEARPVMGNHFSSKYIYHAKSRLHTPVWGSLRSPNNVGMSYVCRMSN